MDRNGNLNPKDGDLNPQGRDKIPRKKKSFERKRIEAIAKEKFLIQLAVLKTMCEENHVLSYYQDGPGSRPGIVKPYSEYKESVLTLLEQRKEILKKIHLFCEDLNRVEDEYEGASLVHVVAHFLPDPNAENKRREIENEKENLERNRELLSSQKTQMESSSVEQKRASQVEEGTYSLEIAFSEFKFIERKIEETLNLYKDLSTDDKGEVIENYYDIIKYAEIIGKPENKIYKIDTEIKDFVRSYSQEISQYLPQSSFVPDRMQKVAEYMQSLGYNSIASRIEDASKDFQRWVNDPAFYIDTEAEKNISNQFMVDPNLLILQKPDPSARH